MKIALYCTTSHTIRIIKSISGKLLGDDHSHDVSFNKKNSLFTKLATRATHIHAQLKWLCQHNWNGNLFFLFRLWTLQMISQFLYLMVQMVNPLIFVLIYLLDRLFHAPEMVFDLTFCFFFCFVNILNTEFDYIISLFLLNSNVYSVFITFEMIIFNYYDFKSEFIRVKCEMFDEQLSDS